MSAQLNGFEEGDLVIIQSLDYPGYVINSNPSTRLADVYVPDLGETLEIPYADLLLEAPEDEYLRKWR